MMSDWKCCMTPVSFWLCNHTLLTHLKKFVDFVSSLLSSPLLIHLYHFAGQDTIPCYSHNNNKKSWREMLSASLTLRFRLCTPPLTTFRRFEGALLKFKRSTYQIKFSRRKGNDKIKPSIDLKIQNSSFAQLTNCWQRSFFPLEQSIRMSSFPSNWMDTIDQRKYLLMLRNSDKVSH